MRETVGCGRNLVLCFVREAVGSGRKRFLYLSKSPVGSVSMSRDGAKKKSIFLKLVFWPINLDLSSSYISKNAGKIWLKSAQPFLRYSTAKSTFLQFLHFLLVEMVHGKKLS